MSKLTSGVLLTIGSPIAYSTAILFKVMPFVSRIETHGGCEAVIEKMPTTPDGELCWDAVRTVVDPVGLAFFIVAATLFVLGLFIIGQVTRRRVKRITRL